MFSRDVRDVLVGERLEFLDRELVEVVLGVPGVRGNVVAATSADGDGSVGELNDLGDNGVMRF